MGYLKKAILIALVAATASLMYLGSYKPFEKSKRYIASSKSVGSARTVDEFKTEFDRAFAYEAPVSDAEMVKYLGKQILERVQSSDDEKINLELIEYIEQYSDKKEAAETLNLAYMYNVLWDKNRTKEYFEKTGDLYKAVLQTAPKIPMALENLFSLYYLTDDAEKAAEVGEKIKTYWPERKEDIDEKMKKLIETQKNHNEL